THCKNRGHGKGRGVAEKSCAVESARKAEFRDVDRHNSNCEQEVHHRGFGPAHTIPPCKITQDQDETRTRIFHAASSFSIRSYLGTPFAWRIPTHTSFRLSEDTRMNDRWQGFHLHLAPDSIHTDRYEVRFWPAAQMSTRGPIGHAKGTMVTI